MKIKAKFHHVLGRNISRVKSKGLGFSEDRYFSETDKSFIYRQTHFVL